MAEPPRDFGAYLREARASRGISLREIADRTKISIHALEALERNDIKRLPGGIFTRAFVRSYAAEAGLDPERTVRMFVERFEGQSNEEDQPSARDLRRVHAEGRQWERPSGERASIVATNLVPIVGGAVLVVAIVAYFLLGRSPTEPPEPRPPEPAASSAPADSRSERATGGSSADTVPARPGTELPPEPTSAPPGPAAGLSLALRVTSDCWVKAVIDGKRTYSRLLRADERVQIDADLEIVLTVGDAGALSYTLNGEPGRALGARGAVITERMTAANYRGYVAVR